MPICSSSRVIGVVLDAVGGGADAIGGGTYAVGGEADAVGGGVDASLPSGETRIARPVPCSRIPATHSAKPAEARASAGRSTRRRISVS
ncbi:hypothetical protein U9R90_06580 [Streptomyces sp. E11-3]|uniref:hypothetical protein n=1 Tax=Streptomyces sp. E11-3 TaxID=3110112 RepID=UPI0039804701